MLQLRHRQIQLKWLWGLMVFLLCLLNLVPVLAQTDLALASLNISLWPEYDRREVLVIYQGQLSPDTTLPGNLTFHLPARVGSLNAVAVVAENGGLVNAVYETNVQDDDLILTFSTSSLNFQFEYYDPGLLITQDGQRTISFETLLDYDVGDLRLEVQEPVRSQEFKIVPEAVETTTGQDGLRYHRIGLGEIPRGDPVALDVSYRRDTDQFSQNTFVTLEDPLPPASPSTPFLQGPTAGYWLIALGAVLLFGVLGYWWWSTQGSQPVPSGSIRRAPHRRPGRRQDKPRPPKSQPPAEPAVTQVKSSGFCYQCGTRLRDDAQFCHQCGAPRRER